MNASDNREKELRQIRSMLDKLGSIAEEACLTGAFGDAGRILLRQYNAILARLKQQHDLPAFLFDILPEETTLQEIGVMGKLLSGYLEEETTAPGQPGLIQPLIVGGPEHFQFKLDDVKKMGQLVREQMVAQVEEERETAGPADRQARLAGIAAEIRAAAERLASPALDEEERVSLAERLRRLGEEQSRLFQ